MAKATKKQTAKTEIENDRAEILAGVITDVYELEKRVCDVDNDLKGLEGTVDILISKEARLKEAVQLMHADLGHFVLLIDKHNWLFGKSWWKRGLAFWGWTMTGYLVILAGILGASFVIGFISALSNS